MNIKVLIGFLLVLIAGFAYLVFAPGSNGLLSRLSKGTQPQTNLPASVLPRFYTKIGSCTMQKTTDPLVISLEKKDKTVTAMLFGKISKVEAAEDGVIIEVISPREDQREGLEITKDTSVFDAIAKKNATLADLRVGQQVYVGISCTPDDLRARKVTSVAITNNKAP